jgi:hypothetical protein
MADKKISALTAASTPLAGTEVLPIVQSGATVKVAVSDLTAGRAISATAVTASTGDITSTAGNFVVGTSGKGIDFSATPGTGTSELLADYEEGDWTPTVTSSSGAITSYTLATCNYTKVGRMVAVNFTVTITNAGTGAGSLDVTLPFTNGAAIANGTGRENALTGVQLQSRVNASTATMNIQTYANTTAIATNAQIRASMTYFV